MNFKCVSKYFTGIKEPVVCGIDEVGRGPWAGPLIACALVLHKNPRIRGLKDSKKLTREKREKAYKKLQKCAYYGLGVFTHDEIDSQGLAKAAKEVFTRAYDDLIKKYPSLKPDIILIDGRDKVLFPITHRSIIKGDENIKVIACASIIAKVERDKLMRDFACEFPQYGFEKHKGYGTALHQEAIKKHGFCEIHRKSYKPIIASFNAIRN
jgi:ribonuclease HII